MLNSLKTRIALVLSLALLLVGSAALWVLDRQAQRATEQLEVALSSSEMQRLLLLFESQTQMTRGVLRAWANWTELYEFAQAPRGTFAADELSIDAVEVTGLNWLVLLDADRRVLVTAERPLSDDPAPIARELAQRPQLLLALVQSGASPEGCGAVRAEGRIGLTCYAPVLPSDGVGTPAGVLVMGRWLDADFMQQVSAQLGLPFSVEVLRPEDSQQVARYEPGRMFTREAPTIDPDGTVLRVSQPLYSLFGWQVARLELQWPRQPQQDAAQRLKETRWLVALLVGVTGLVVWLLVHQWVIAPLAQLRRAMQTTLAQRQWGNTLDTGRTDEIGGLTRSIDDLLGVVRRHVDELEHLSLTDTLTGLPNRRAFNERLRFLLALHQRLQAALAADPLEHSGNPPYGQLTISIGLSQLVEGDTPETVYRRADRALYDAKAQGRNRVVVGW